MAKFIPENILDDILSRVDIVEVISGYIPLKRSGKNFKANCPFHHEKTPSFMVSSDRQIYHCFGCGESGNAFKFLMRYERLDFPEAVENLAKKAGIVLPENKETGSRTVSVSTQLYKINELALRFYEHSLNSKEAQTAKNYLLERGIKEESIKLFRLGFAPDKWEALINYLRAKDVPLSLLEKAGLILEKKGGGYYDRFRNRPVFPIFDIKSKALGFGARILPSSDKSKKEENSLPKYINSPETPIYTKGKNLYGLNFAKDSIRENDYVVIVEGYLDFIIPFQEGLQNIAASLGTALTEDQVRSLKRYTNNVVMVYDGDSAGQIATLRTLDIFIQEGVNVKVVSLPEGFDPDSFVRKNGIAGFKEKINNAEKLFDYKLRILKSQYNAGDAEGKAKISLEMLVTISKFNNAVLKSEYIKKLGEALNVNEGALLQEMGKIKVDSRSFQSNPAAAKRAIKINPTEKLLIKLMLEETALINRIKENLAPADFQDELTSKIVSTMFSLAEQGKAIDTRILINHLRDEDVSQIICESAFMPEVSTQKREEIIDDCLHRLKKERIKLKRQDLHEQIRSAQNSGDEEKLNLLMQEFHLLMKKG